MKKGGSLDMDKKDNLMARFLYPENGWPTDVQKACEMKLEVGKDYPVYYVEMGRFNTRIILDGFPGTFNSVQFEFYVDGKKIDIYSNPKFNPYIIARNDE